MTLKDLWEVAPQTHIFIREGNTLKEYLGEGETGGKTVQDIQPKSYPMYSNVIEVILKKGEQ